MKKELQLIISDYENEKFRPYLAELAKRNKDSIENHSDLLEKNIWIKPCGNFNDKQLKSKCLICSKILVSEDLFIERQLYNIRYHGYLHLKEANLLAFL